MILINLLYGPRTRLCSHYLSNVVRDGGLPDSRVVETLKLSQSIWEVQDLRKKDFIFIIVIDKGPHQQY